jgi:hypothetical protein
MAESAASRSNTSRSEWLGGSRNARRDTRTERRCPKPAVGPALHHDNSPGLTVLTPHIDGIDILPQDDTSTSHSPSEKNVGSGYQGYFPQPFDGQHPTRRLLWRDKPVQRRRNRRCSLRTRSSEFREDSLLDRTRWIERWLLFYRLCWLASA